jgi:hypothetical protein
VLVLTIVVVLARVVSAATTADTTASAEITIVLSCVGGGTSDKFAEAVLLACEESEECAELTRKLRAASGTECARDLATRTTSRAEDRAACSREALVGALGIQPHEKGGGRTDSMVMQTPRAILSAILEEASVQLGSSGPCDRAGADLVIRALVHAWNAWRKNADHGAQDHLPKTDLCDGGDGVVYGEHSDTKTLLVARMTATSTLVFSLLVAAVVVFIASQPSPSPSPSPSPLSSRRRRPPVTAAMASPPTPGRRRNATTHARWQTRNDVGTL